MKPCYRPCFMPRREQLFCPRQLHKLGITKADDRKPGQRANPPFSLLSLQEAPHPYNVGQYPGGLMCRRLKETKVTAHGKDKVEAFKVFMSNSLNMRTHKNNRPKLILKNFPIDNLIISSLRVSNNEQALIIRIGDTEERSGGATPDPNGALPQTPPLLDPLPNTVPHR